MIYVLTIAIRQVVGNDDAADDQIFTVNKNRSRNVIKNVYVSNAQSIDVAMYLLPINKTEFINKWLDDVHNTGIYSKISNNNKSRFTKFNISTPKLNPDIAETNMRFEKNNYYKNKKRVKVKTPKPVDLLKNYKEKNQNAMFGLGDMGKAIFKKPYGIFNYKHKKYKLKHEHKNHINNFNSVIPKTINYESERSDEMNTLVDG